jgi:hypothetical protein
VRVTGAVRGGGAGGRGMAEIDAALPEIRDATTVIGLLYLKLGS